MFKKHILLLFCLLVNLPIFAQNKSAALQQKDKISPVAQAAQWASLKNTLVGFGSSNVRYSKSLPVSNQINNNWQVAAWKNEKIHTQIIVSAKQNIKNLSVTTGNLYSQNGHKISHKNIAVGFVQYVMTDEFGGGCGYRKPEDFDSSLVADIINTDVKSINIAPNSTQPIWISISIPKNAAAGNYQGYLTIKAKKQYQLKITLTVLDKTLPSPKDWTFHLDYWQYPASIARVHNVKLWSNAHFKLMRKYYTQLADAGQKAITASIVDEPWGHQTFDDYPSLIKWTKKADGSWEYDYTLFDKYINFVMSCGITEQINCYSMVPWKIAFKYFDEKSNQYKQFTKAIGTPEYNQFWSRMLTDFTAHLKKKGWFGITTIAMDERPMKAMQSVIKLLKSIDPNWKIALAGNYHSEIEPDIYDYCIASRHHFPKEILEKRTSQGKKSTWYTCCTEQYPNEFTFSPPAEATWVGWYTAASNMDGFLRWAYNAWPKDPLHDSRFTAWPGGDTYQVYPGPLSSIRLEKLIEGIQDFEKIKILRKEYKKNNETEKLDKLNKALNEFTIPNLAKETARQMVEKYKALLN